MEALQARIADRLAASIHPDVAAFGQVLADEAGASAVLFYGSNLRTGSLEGVLDFYVLLPGPQQERIWPRVSYHERASSTGETLRAKVATMSLERFAQAAEGNRMDTTIWARFVQPSGLVWARNDAAKQAVISAIGLAAQTAARLAAAIGPNKGAPEDFWRALFRATYKAEFRVEKPGREDSILSVNTAHFEGLFPIALEADGIAFDMADGMIAPKFEGDERACILAWWKRRRRIGKPLNVVRLVKASTTFDGAAGYAAWKIERHTGVPVQVTDFREKHPLLSAPAVMLDVWRQRGR